MKSNIVLIGFMGTGKTTVGRLLAQKLGRKFIETDSVIERLAGKSIPQIFQSDGEIAFRELEIEAIKETARSKRAVIAGGGGIVLNKINIDRLKENGKIVYLTAAPREIIKRVAAGAGQRPLLEVGNPALAVRDLLRFRKPFYERSADIIINTANMDIEAIAGQIIDRLKEDESFDFSK